MKKGAKRKRQRVETVQERKEDILHICMYKKKRVRHAKEKLDERKEGE